MENTTATTGYDILQMSGKSFLEKTSRKPQIRPAVKPVSSLPPALPLSSVTKANT